LGRFRRDSDTVVTAVSSRQCADKHREAHQRRLQMSCVTGAEAPCGVNHEYIKE